MQILTFVITLLMLMALLTYARIGFYQDNASMQLIFKKGIENREQKIYSTAAQKLYEITPAKKGNGGKRESSKGVRYFSIALLINAAERMKQPLKAKAAGSYFKRLLEVLYGDQEFFQEFLAARPNALQELVDQIEESSALLSQDQQLKSIKEIANLTLKDPELQFFFYKLLKGGEVNGVIQKKSPSLFHYLTAENKKLRLYLASKPLLVALLGSSEAADHFIHQREQIFLALNKKEKGSSEKKKETLDSLIPDQSLQVLDKSWLDFSTSKTDPRPYR